MVDSFVRAKVYFNKKDIDSVGVSDLELKTKGRACAFAFMEEFEHGALHLKAQQRRVIHQRY